MFDIASDKGEPLEKAVPAIQQSLSPMCEPEVLRVRATRDVYHAMSSSISMML